MFCAWAGAAGRIAYALIPLVCNGSTFGMDRRIDLRLIDVEFSMVKLQGERDYCILTDFKQPFDCLPKKEDGVE